MNRPKRCRRSQSLHPPHPLLVPKAFQCIGYILQPPQESTVRLIRIMGREPGVYVSRRWIDVGDITTPTGNLSNLGVLPVQAFRRVLVHRRIRVGKPVLTGGRVGEIDDPEVDLTALSRSRVVATLGRRPDHQVLAVRSTERSGEWRGRVLIHFFTICVRALADLLGRGGGSGRARRILLMVLPPLQ